MAEAKMKQPSVPLGPIVSIDEDNPLTNEQQEIQPAVPSQTKSGPNLADRFLLQGSRDEYLRLGVPLYEASIKCDWKAAEEILTKKENLELGLVRCSITENGETALHVAASAKVPGKVEKFVKNLVKLMTKEDLELENENYNTALYLAAAAGNIETVKIMMEVNEKLLSIPGGGSQNSKPQMMPMYTAALFGNHEVVKYMYEKSNGLIEGDWTPTTRAWLLEKCVENNMFDIAIKIVKRYPKLGITGTVLGILARKPEAFVEPDFNIIQATISWGQHLCKHLFSKMSISDRLPNKKLSEKTCSDIGKAIESAKRLYYSSIIGRTTNYTTRPIKYVFKVISSKVVPPENKKEALQLLKIIWNDIARMKKKEIDDIIRGPLKREQDDKLATANVDQAKQLFSERIVKMQLDVQNIITSLQESSKEDQTVKLQNVISNHIAQMHVETQNVANGLVATSSKTPHTKKTYPSRILFVAAEMGNTTFVVELIRQYPDLIWKVNDNGLSIFHIAVKHRHEGIYNLLYEIGSMKDMITPLRDEHENNMLHLVGKIAKKRRLEDVSGFALQMQRELLWFQEVRNMIPPSYRERKNKDDLTPHELFTKEHKDLVIRGEEWMKGTASQCMVVAALIATIVFAAAFTVPGGYAQSNDKASNQMNGVPVFHSKATFMVFVVADAISLFSSSASILMFLSILTSRYAERDFLESLPKKLMLGLATLFLSITTMTVAFSVSFFVLYHKGLLWIPILIGALAVLPVLLYIKLQYGLFVDVIRSTYGSRYLFKPRKHVLYYKNPEV